MRRDSRIAATPRTCRSRKIFVDGLGAGSETKRRAKAQQILSTMLGALTFARAMSDADASDAFLSQVRSQVLRELKEPTKQ